jgi:dTDP-4-amino-4,6-dideoxygalactose transaminase
VIPVDIGGLMCDYAALYAAVEQSKSLFKPSPGTLQENFDRAIVLADAAHSFGAEQAAKASGSVADFTAFSFHAVKNITTAEGGALVWKDHPDIDNNQTYKQLIQMSLHGQSKDALAKNSLGAWEYDIMDTAYKCNMTDVAAAMGRSQLQRYPQILERRRQIVQRYESDLANSADLELETLQHVLADNSSSCHLYLVRLIGRSEQFRNQLIQAMAQKEVVCNVHYKPLPLLTAYRNLGFDIANYPNAFAQYQNQLTLPLYSTLSYQQQEFVISSFKQSYLECVAAGV